jgi:HD-GYP domain-containing protein (c-di-GMP phosphodiesterase class II)
MAVLFTVGMLVVLAVGVIVARSLTRRIQELVASAERVTAGDLTARSEVKSQDELGKLGACLNRMTDRLEGQYMATMRALASAVAGSDPYTLRHSLRVGDLAAKLGRHMGVDERTHAQLEIGGYLHDVGKIGARDSGVLEATHLAPRHREHIDSHPHIGVQAPSTDYDRPVLDFLGHTEAHGNGKQAAQVARIVAVADLYDALTADRPDGLPLTSEEALVVMRALTGEALHPGTVEALAEILPGWEREQGRGSDYKAIRDAANERPARERRAPKAAKAAR